VYEATEWAGAGGLLAYGVTHADLFRGSASYVAKILRGARPAELPVQQPARIPLVVNVRTARALSLKVPPSLLARAELVGE
jgi:putative ABC transport system substrate-binding protein